MRLCAIAALAWLAASPVAAQGFLSRLPDLPVMAGLVESPDAGFVFDNPVGRIVEAVAAGVVDPAAVTAFYHTTLVELGWRPAPGGLVFVREGERLAIAIEGAGPRLTVRFTITPDRRCGAQQRLPWPTRTSWSRRAERSV